MGNYGFIMDHGNKNWLEDLRNTFQDCYVFSSRDTDKCFFRHTRFHWSDPLSDNPQWLVDVAKLPPYLDDDWRTDPRYKEISKEIKSEDDLQKIIFENPHILKQGDRCTIKGWQDFISEQFKIIYTRRKDRSEASDGDDAHYFQGQYWWRYGMFDAQRFSVDAYAFLRMFRKKESQLDKWNTANRFENIIYHAGQWHIDDMKQMLLNLNTKTVKFRVVSETRADADAASAHTDASAAASASASADIAAAAASADIAAADDDDVDAAIAAYYAAAATYTAANAAADIAATKAANAATKAANAATKAANAAAAANAARDTYDAAEADAATKTNVCCRVDFRKFLQIIEDKKAVHKIRDTREATEDDEPPFGVLDPGPASTFIVGKKPKAVLIQNLEELTQKLEEQNRKLEELNIKLEEQNRKLEEGGITNIKYLEYCNNYIIFYYNNIIVYY